MPKSLFPLRGGPYPPAWAARQSPQTPPAPEHESASQSTEVQLDSRRALKAEIKRLRQELARVQKQKAGGGRRLGNATTGMVWLALAVCGAGLVFALMAILNHG